MILYVLAFSFGLLEANAEGFLCPNFLFERFGAEIDF